MQYTEENRGQFQHKDRARQIIAFSGIKYGNITPTDIDGFFEKEDKVFVFFELKHGDAKVPAGQKLALTRLVDALTKAGKKAVLFVASHNTADPYDDVIAKDAIVTAVYFNGMWHSGGDTLKNMTDRFMKWAYGREV